MRSLIEINYFNKSLRIGLSSVPAFILLFVIVFTFVVISLLDVAVRYVILFNIIAFIFGIAFILIKKNNIAFVLLGICLGGILFSNINNDRIYFKDKSYPKQPAVIYGKVVKIINQKANKTRLIINGDIAAKELPDLKNHNVLLTIYGKNRIEYGSTITAYCSIQPPRIASKNNDFSERNYTRNLGVTWVATANGSAVKIVNLPNFIDRIRNNIYQSIQLHIDKLFTANTANIVQAFILGKQSDIDNDIKQNFRISGVSHILALSGLHISIITAILFVFFSLFPVNNWIKFILLALFVAAFIFLTGMLPSAIRAGGMAILFVFGKTIQRPVNTLNIMSVVILIAVIISPNMLYSVSFQLSSIAVLGICIFYKFFRNSFYSFVKTEISTIKYLFNLLALTLSTSIIINPLVAYYFDMLSIISPLTNLLIVPIFTLVLNFAIISVVLSYIYLPIALLYAGSVELLVDIIVKIVKFMANIDFAAVVKHEHITIISIAISLTTIYIFSSRQKQQLLFRLGISVICCVMLYLIFI